MKSILIITLLFFCSLANAQVNPNATQQTKELYNRLKRLPDGKTYFGQMQFLDHREPGASANGDVYDLVGKYPMILGDDWDFTQVNEAMTETKRQLIIDHHERGGIVTLSWHMKNYATDGDNRDTGGLVLDPVFLGSGLNDMTTNGEYKYSTAGPFAYAATYTFTIDSEGTPDTFKWKKDDEDWTEGVAITGDFQTTKSNLKPKFTNTTGHTLGDTWTVTTETSHDVIKPGGRYRDNYLADLDDFADWLNALVDSNGNKIPILFRPFQENDGSWFWWGRKAVVVGEFKDLWQDMFNYLQTEKGVDNLLWVYAPSFMGDGTNPQSDGTPSTFESYYPEADYFDVVGMSLYILDCSLSLNDYLSKPYRTHDKAYEYDKIFTLTEGFGNIATEQPTGCHNEDWWGTDTFDIIRADEKLNKLKYVFIWNTGQPLYPNWRYSPAWHDDQGFTSSYQRGNFLLLGDEPLTITGASITGAKINK